MTIFSRSLPKSKGFLGKHIQITMQNLKAIGATSFELSRDKKFTTYRHTDRQTDRFKALLNQRLRKQYAANCTGSKLSYCSALIFLMRLCHRVNMSFRKIFKKCLLLDVGNITLISKIDFFRTF